MRVSSGMNSILCFAFFIACGWAGGKALGSLCRANEEGKFGITHWLIFLGLLGAAGLVSRFVIRNLKLIPDLPDFVVGASGICFLVTAALTSEIFRAKKE